MAASSQRMTWSSMTLLALERSSLFCTSLLNWGEGGNGAEWVRPPGRERLQTRAEQRRRRVAARQTCSSAKVLLLIAPEPASTRRAMHHSRRLAGGSSSSGASWTLNRGQGGHQSRTRIGQPVQEREEQRPAEQSRARPSKLTLR